MSGHMEYQDQSDLAKRLMIRIERDRPKDQATLEDIGFRVGVSFIEPCPEEAPLFRVSRDDGYELLAAVESAHNNGTAGLRQAFASGYLRVRAQAMSYRIRPLVIVRAKSCSTESAQMLQRYVSTWMRRPGIVEWRIVCGKRIWYAQDDECSTIMFDRMKETDQ